MKKLTRNRFQHPNELSNVQVQDLIALDNLDKASILRGKKGKSYDITIVQRTRHNLGLTQNQFAEKLGISVSTLRSWEQRQRQPSKTTMGLFKIVASMMNSLQDPTLECKLLN